MSTKSKYSEALGAEEAVGSILIVVFIPSKTAKGKPLPAGQSQELWAGTVGDTLAKLYGGSTQMPPARGKWLNEDDDEVITEEVVLVHSYANPKDAEDPAKLKELAKVLHRMGKVTRQGEIGVVIDSIFHKIRKFPLADERASK